MRAGADMAGSEDTITLSRDALETASERALRLGYPSVREYVECLIHESALIERAAPPALAAHSRERLEELVREGMQGTAHPWDQAEWDRQRQALIEKYSKKSA
jgi:hypothetical protein